MRSVTERRRQAYRFELDPNREHRALLAMSAGASRYVYNWGLAESQRIYEVTNRRPQLRELKSQLVSLKKGECPWLSRVSAHIGQQALVDLDRAFVRFFRGLTGEGPRSGFPRFKRKGERDSARLYGVELFERHIWLPKIGRVRLKETRSSRGFEGRILSATISRRADRWFVSLAVERECSAMPPATVTKATDIIGVDFGLKAIAVTYDGKETHVIEPVQALRRNLAKVRRLDRQLARKQLGSRNREKAKLCRARLNYKISCQRHDLLHKLSSQLARTKPVIVLEDLDVKGMARNRFLGLSVHDAALGALRRQLIYKCEWYGSRLIVVDRRFPSTQLCSDCGVLNEKVRGFDGLKTRRFDCDACGLSRDRDENAAINLRRAGLVELGIVPLPEGLREVTPDREEGAGSSNSGVKPASAKQEAKALRLTRRDPQKQVERRAGTGSTGD